MQQYQSWHACRMPHARVYPGLALEVTTYMYRISENEENPEP